MQVSRWGETLAVRLPENVVAAMNLQEGDEIEIDASGEGAFLSRRGSSQEPGKLFQPSGISGGQGHAEGREEEPEQTRLRRLQALRRLEELSTPLPPGFQFDREEANER